MNVNILRVFCNNKSEFGNPVGIVVDEKQELTIGERQNIAAKLNFSETVFVNDLKYGNLSIYNPIKEVKFAGHALVGTSYFISKTLGKLVNSLNCKGGHVETWQDGGLTWIKASLAGTPPWKHEQLTSVNLVENFEETREHTVIWAWLDENKGIVRARTFAPDWGISEDEANGSGSMQLAAMLGKRLEIHHGKGSIIYAYPLENNFAAVGGKVKEEVSKELSF